jgi:proton glutamate symport protein
MAPTLHLAIASIFVAQAAGIELSMSQQLLMMGTLMLTSKGVAAVPRASIVVLSGTLTAFGLPLEGIASFWVWINLWIWPVPG